MAEYEEAGTVAADDIADDLLTAARLIERRIAAEIPGRSNNS